MRTPIRTAAGLALLTGLSVIHAQTAPAQTAPAQTAGAQRTHRWWTDRPAGARAYTTNAKTMPLISVKGNKFIDPQGRAILFRGLSISDPDKLEMQGHWSRDHFVKVKEMGTKLVRIPIHPVAWRERTPSEYLKLLDQAVGWCTELCGKGISWTVWCFDPEWGPTLIRNWDYQLNASGEFAKAAMNGEIK